MKSVQIQNADMLWPIAANILLPSGFDESRAYPTIVSVHPFGSSGVPRWIESPIQRDQDSGHMRGNLCHSLARMIQAFSILTL